MAKGKPAKPKVTDLRQANVTVDLSIQPRANGLDQQHVQDLMEAIRGGAKLPSVVVYRTPAGEHILSEGFHRAEAYRRVGNPFIRAEVREGSREDAALNAMASNKEHHALKRTNADKRRAVAEALRLAPKWSDRRIADHVGVGYSLVAEVRSQLPESGSSPTRTGKDGKERPVSQPKAPPAVASPAPATPGPEDEYKNADTPTSALFLEPDPEAGGDGCYECGGEGVVDGSECPACAGDGWLPDEAAPPMATSPPAAPPKASEPAVLRDSKGRPVPAKLEVVFRDVSRMRGYAVRFGTLVKELEEFVKTSPAGSAVPQQAVKMDLAKCLGDLAGAVPYVICPTCDALDPACRVCGGTSAGKKIQARGWLPKCRYDQLTAPQKEVCEGPWGDQP